MEHQLPFGFITTDKFGKDEQDRMQQACDEMLKAYEDHKNTTLFPEFAQKYINTHYPQWKYHTTRENYSSLQAASNVIELKPNHTYLLVFKGDGITESAIEFLGLRMRQMGIQNLAIKLTGNQDVEVIQVPKEKPPIYPVRTHCGECGKEIVPSNQYRAWIDNSPRNLGFVCEECYVKWLEKHGDRPEATSPHASL